MSLYYKRRRRKLFFFVILPSLLLILISSAISQISPLFIRLSEDKIYSLAFNLVNDILAKELEKIEPQSLIDYKYSDTGNITAVSANVIAMNKLIAQISQTISYELSKIDNLYVNLPVGSLINGKFLSGIGPKIPIKVMLLDNISSTYNTDFFSTGINQTCHRIFVKVECNVRILSQLAKDDLNIDIEIPIAETIIVGNVPTTYFSF